MENPIKFDFDDILIEPSALSTINSRKDIDLFYEDGFLPLFTAPMDTVIGPESKNFFLDSKIRVIMPRTYGYSSYSNTFPHFFRSLGLEDFERIFINEPPVDNEFYILIDIANGHMKRLLDLVQKAKGIYGKRLNLMVGNVANPETYRIFSEAGADYIRIGIGNGCFVPKTPILTKEGSREIHEIKIGDLVLTHKNRYREVEEIFTYEKEETLTVINGECSTGNHEYYVIDKKNKDLVNPQNLEEYAKWIPAELLDDEIHLAVQFLPSESDKTLGSILNLIPIKKEMGGYKGIVYDLRVKEDHSYNVGGTIVHNSGCLTTVQTGVGYPMASLIHECSLISCTLQNPSKIVADGGFKSYSDIIKALALGADYVMIGSIFNKALESSGDTYLANIKNEGWTEPGEMVDQYSEETRRSFSYGNKMFKKFRGMSTKEAQRAMGKSEIKTSEGITRMQPVEYTISGWVDNFKSYLSSAMSYSDAGNLSEFIGFAKWNLISINSLNRFKK